MSSPSTEAIEHICYRCRRAASNIEDLIGCNYCPLYWHLNCIPPPFSSDGKNWMCPRHQKPFDPKKRNIKLSSKSKARMDIIESFEEADEIVKYGGVAHNITEEAIENDFLVYAKRYRQFNRSEKDVKEQKSEEDEVKIKLEAEEWLDSLTTFDSYGTNYDGIQMLLDASSRSSDKSEINNSRQDIDLDDRQHEQFEAIQELINLKGEDTLLELLSQKYR